MRKNFPHVLALSLSVFCLVTVGALQKPFLSENFDLTAEDYQRQEDAKQAQLDIFKKMPTFGFDNLISDWAYLDFIQYNGDYLGRETTGYSLLPDYYELVVTKDPRFVEAYFLLDVATTLFAGQPNVSNKWIEYGLDYIVPEIPLAYQVLIFKGTLELLFLGTPLEAKKSFEKAAEWAIIEDTETSLIVADGMSQRAKFLAQNPDSRRVRIGSWINILRNVRDVRGQKVAIENLRKLGAKVIVNDDGKVEIELPDSLD